MKTERKIKARMQMAAMKARDRMELRYLLVFAGCIVYVVCDVCVRGFV